MNTFLTYLPIIIAAVFVAFAGILIIHHESADDDEEPVCHKCKHHKTV
jgi:hypothetical protein